MAFSTRIALGAALFCTPSMALAQQPGNTAPSPEQPGLDQPALPDRPASPPRDNAPQAAIGVVCDTAEQMQQFLRLHMAGEEPAKALNEVNAQSHNPKACGVLATAYVENKEITHLSVASGILRLVEITVVALRNATGWHRVPPTVQYTALFVKGREV